LSGDAETLRETIHEIKTPLNAIIGFAEIIDGQYLGPAHRNYRHRAAEIVAQARILLAAIEDLDFAARIQTGGGQAGSPVELGALFPPIAEELASRADARGVLLRIHPLGGGQHCNIDKDVAGRLLRRFVGAIVDAAAPGEGLNLSLREERGRCLVAVTRPASTLNLAEKQLLDPTFATAEENQASRLGLGFALRLVRGLARLAGGELRFGKADITLAIPAARS
jgi:signal transduction histidine kinase